MARSKPIKASEAVHGNGIDMVENLKEGYEAISSDGTEGSHTVETTCERDDSWINGASTSTGTGASSTSDFDFDIISIVKEELKHNIQRKRQERGLDDINVDEHVSRSYQLTETEQMKRQQRKERNRIAAAKCREKKRQLTMQIIRETDTLEKSNYDLQKQTDELKTEKAYLQRILQEHLMICPKRLQHTGFRT